MEGIVLYAVDDYVVYGIHGVCRITDLQEQSVGEHRQMYYVLEPMDQFGAKYMLPLDNPVVLAKIRPLMTKEELEHLLYSSEVNKDCWVADENKRKQTYRELINGGDRAALIRMIGTLERHKQAQALAGRKFHLCDENFLKDAKKLIESEIALILGIEKHEVGTYIKQAIYGE